MWDIFTITLGFFPPLIGGKSGWDCTEIQKLMKYTDEKHI